MVVPLSMIMWCVIASTAVITPSMGIYCYEDDCYSLLGVSNTAHFSEIKKAYYKLSLKHHPDKNPDDPKSTNLFVKIANAYEVLKDEATRRQYDFATSYSYSYTYVKEVKILPKQLKISWDKDPYHWRFYGNDNQLEESCYAELIEICWFEVIGKFEGLVRNKKYSVGFTISFKEDSFGWYDRPLYLMAKSGRNGKEIWKKINLDPYKRGTSLFNIPESDKLIVETNHDEYGIHLGLYEIWSGHWKGGLRIHYAFAQLV